MEMFVMRKSEEIPVSMARFANVAFSDGSLLHGFNQRIEKRQPIVAPNDIKRYFVTPQESGELCLMCCIFGENRDIFFPKLSEDLHLISFADIAVKYLKEKVMNLIFVKMKMKQENLLKLFPKKENGLVFLPLVTLQVKKTLKSFLQIKRRLIWKDLKTSVLLKMKQF